MSNFWVMIAGLVFLAMLPAYWLGYLLPGFLGVALAAAAYGMLGSSLFRVLPGATSGEFGSVGMWAAVGAGGAAFLGTLHGRAARRDRAAKGANRNDRQGKGEDEK